MTTVTVTSEHDIGNARRQVLAFCQAVPFDERELGEIAIIVTEMASNLARHATAGGIIKVEPLPVQAGIRITAADNGPGLADLRLLDDRNSTKKSLGGGLGAIRRLADNFAIEVKEGTWIQIDKLAKVEQKKCLKVGAYVRPHPKCQVSGDGFTYLERKKPLVAVVDGLGHGPDAALVRRLACSKLKDFAGHALQDILSRIHVELRGTRGAAMLVAELDNEARVIRYFSIGNIEGRVIGRNSISHLQSQPGIVGYRLPCPQIREEPWRPGMALVITSDGVSSGWSKKDFPDWDKEEPGLFCQRIVREFGRATDDAIALVVRYEG
jgi:anti-sigma regulatory factor (Ser/Thr protein kinase)